MEHCQGDESGEPEQARQSIEDEYDPFVEEGPVGFGAAAGEDGVEEEVGEGEEGEEDAGLELAEHDWRVGLLRVKQRRQVQTQIPFENDNKRQRR